MTDVKKMQAVSWRKDPIILSRIHTVQELRFKGLNNQKIASRLKISEGTVRLDLGRLAQLWADDISRDEKSLRAEKIAELKDIKGKAISIAEWDQMCERAVLFDEQPSDDEITVLVSDPPRRMIIHRDAKDAAMFRGAKAQSLDVARKATMDGAKLLGLDKDKGSTDEGGSMAALIEILRQMRAAQ